jgi:predicted ribosome quality control (RQC) complex YloA/Tae2 family protein
MPVRLGPGAPVEDVLGYRDPREGTGSRRTPDRDAGEEARRITERIARLRDLLGHRPPAAALRRWGELLLANTPAVRPGMDSVVLADWDGTLVEIPLRRGRTAAENAARFFRKASSSDEEAARISARIEELEGELPGAGRGGSGGVRPGGGAVPGTAPGRRPPVDLGMGWVCWVGRNARDNEELTFVHARRDDWWLHARGTPGPHVILRGDSRSGNPPAQVLLRAAELAASRCGSGVVPVDVVPVKHVRRMKGGRPGEVVYSGERTLFVGRGAGGSRRTEGTEA